MDTITHGIIGALIGKAFFADNSPAVKSWREPPKTVGRAAICASTLGAVFPDIDTLAGPIAHNSLAIMTWHRGITHSILLLPAWAIGLALLTRWLCAHSRWRFLLDEGLIFDVRIEAEVCSPGKKVPLEQLPGYNL